LHTTITAKRWNTHRAGFSYKLKFDDNDDRVFMFIKNTLDETNCENNIYWRYDRLFNKKLTNLAVLYGKSRKYDNHEYFTFESCKLYTGFKFDKFCQYIKDGLIAIDVRLGVHRELTSKNYGKKHDHGTAFRIDRAKFQDLYSTYEEI
jgi:hypothetical protein